MLNPMAFLEIIAAIKNKNTLLEYLRFLCILLFHFKGWNISTSIRYGMINKIIQRNQKENTIL